MNSKPTAFPFCGKVFNEWEQLLAKAEAEGTSYDISTPVKDLPVHEAILFREKVDRDVSGNCPYIPTDKWKVSINNHYSLSALDKRNNSNLVNNTVRNEIAKLVVRGNKVFHPRKVGKRNLPGEPHEEYNDPKKYCLLIARNRLAEGPKYEKDGEMYQKILKFWYMDNNEVVPYKWQKTVMGWIREAPCKQCPKKQRLSPSEEDNADIVVLSGMEKGEETPDARGEEVEQEILMEEDSTDDIRMVIGGDTGADNRDQQGRMEDVAVGKATVNQEEVDDDKQKDEDHDKQTDKDDDGDTGADTRDQQSRDVTVNEEEEEEEEEEENDK